MAIWKTQQTSNPFLPFSLFSYRFGSKIEGRKTGEGCISQNNNFSTLNIHRAKHRETKRNEELARNIIAQELPHLHGSINNSSNSGENHIKREVIGESPPPSEPTAAQSKQ
jgi:hypothetical protein